MKWANEWLERPTTSTHTGMTGSLKSCTSVKEIESIISNSPIGLDGFNGVANPPNF
jgi:hypothetical protein